MKTLTKIKLINWHGFVNETINVKGSILLLGENGSGKSTLLDALYYLISAGQQDKFNVAANENATRTLETYMRGKLGMENKKELRSNPNLISHIALEFFDDLSKNYFVLGVVLEIQENTNRIGHDFYYVKNSKLNEDFYVKNLDGDKIGFLNFKAMQRKFSKDKVEQLGTTKKETRRKIKSILGLENEKYFELLPKAIAFKPIPDVSKFVYDFLMPQKDINLDAVRINIKSYNDIQEKIDIDKKKNAELDKILSSVDNYNKRIKLMKLLKCYELKLSLDSNCLQKVKIENSLQKLNAELTKINSELSEIKEQIKRIVDTIANLKANDAYRAVDNFEKELIQLGLDEVRLEKNESSLNKAILAENEIAKLLDISMNLAKHIRNKNYEEFIGEIKSYKQIYENEVDRLREDIYELSAKLKSENAQKKVLMTEKEQLEKGTNSYKAEVSLLIDLIKKGTNYKTKVVPLCELIEIKNGDEEWQNAIEGYLNTKRFDLFVDNDYFDQALTIYESNKKEYKLHGVGLVNVNKLKDVDIKANSLANKIETYDIKARQYVDYLLGEIICVDKENELKLYNSSITKTVMVYKNKACRQTKFEVYKVPYIGRNAILKRTAILNGQINDLNTDIINDTALVNKNTTLKDKVGKTQYAYLIQTNDVWQELEQLLDKKMKIKSELNEVKPFCGTLSLDIEKFEAEKEKFYSNEKKLSESISDLKASIMKNNEDLTIKNSKIKELEDEFSIAIKNNDTKIELENFANEKKYDIPTIIKEKTTVVEELNRAKYTAENDMKTYIVSYGFDANPTIDSAEIFEQEKISVVSRNLAEYQEKLNTVKEKAIETFKNSYIYEIKNNIQNEKRNIEKLNKVLASKAFGSNQEVYKFEVEKSKDRNFATYYDIFMSNEDFEVNDLFTESLSDKNQELMQELFFRLATETTDAKQDKLIREYTDYRSFMSYDIKIKDKHENISYFSKINKEKSGGETQTPFYVIVAASFDQIVHTGYGQNSSACLMILDEAFNNMDAPRIDSMMQYFDSLNIQPIIAVPSQRAKTIFPYVNTIIPIAKSRDIIKPRPMILR